jgi:hypothetical protein
MPPVSWLRICFLTGAIIFAGISAQILRGPVSFISEMTLVVLSSIGIVGGITLLTVNLTWGPTQFVWRCFEYWMWFVTGLFVLAVTVQPPPHILGDIILFISWYNLCCQASLWAARYLLNARIALPTSGSQDRWGVRDLAIGSTMVAVAMASIRISRNVDEWLLMGAMFGAIATLVVFPPALIVLRMKWWCIALVCYLIAVVGGFLGIFYSQGLDPFYNPAQENTYMFLIAVIGPCLGVLALRFEGYRLLWRGEPRDVSEQKP